MVIDLLCRLFLLVWLRMLYRMFLCMVVLLISSFCRFNVWKVVFSIRMLSVMIGWWLVDRLGRLMLLICLVLSSLLCSCGRVLVVIVFLFSFIVV